MSAHRNRVKMTVSGTPGTGTITLSAASSGYQSFAAAYGANATVDILIEEGTSWEVARDCTYTNSGTTVTRGTLEASSTGSAVSFTSSAVVSVIATADRGRTWDAAALNTQVAGTDADTTMAVNTLYVVDMSVWATADRTYTLPATAAVGDMIGIVVSDGNTSTFELLITAGAGDTLSGIAGGTEWSRVFITGETVIMRCTSANATWMVVQDGRIPQTANLGLTTDADGEGAATWVLPTSFGGAWTQGAAVGATTNTANGNINIRRAGTYNTTVMSRAKDSVADGQYYGVRIGKNNAEYRSRQCFASAAQTTSAILNDPGVVCAAGDTLQLYYVSQAGGVGARGAAGAVTFISVTEVL